MDPYDLLPYESIAFPETHPASLAALGRLFGLDTPEPTRARVLELGCASGGNLVPMAWRLPEARFVGIDLSAPQIEDGLAMVRRLGLGNVELRAADILALGAELGPFDYIIAHGVYSWVPDPVRTHLLALAGQLLSPGGLFYVSYNTLPGWRMRGMLRDILLYACRDADTPGARISAAQAALDRLEAAVGKLGALSTRYLTEEIAGLRKAHPSYLLFEYLAEHNRAFLFSDFIRDADGAGLRYLCDTELRTVFPSTYGDAVEAALAPIQDGVELEQWLDFVTNRNFRQSVLCRADAVMDDAIDLERFAELAFAADLQPPKKLDLKRAKDAPFTTRAGVTLSVAHPLTKALVAALVARYPDCLPLEELMPGAVSAVAAAGGGAYANQVDECLAELFSLFAHRGLTARLAPLRTRRGIPERPRADALALAQVQAGSHRVATLHHGNLDLDSFALRLLTLLDGTRSVESAAAQLAEELAAGDLMPPPGVQPRQWNPERLAERTRAAAADLTALFARYGVLEPEPEAAC
jgi:methyltransferase-like protein